MRKLINFTIIIPELGVTWSTLLIYMVLLQVVAMDEVLIFCLAVIFHSLEKRNMVGIKLNILIQQQNMDQHNMDYLCSDCDSK